MKLGIIGNKLIMIAILLIVSFLSPIYAQSIPSDTTETAGRGARIAGFVICGIGIGMLAVLTPLAYAEGRNSKSCVQVLSYNGKGVHWVLSGAVTIGGSLTFFIPGFRKRNSYLRWKKAKNDC